MSELKLITNTNWVVDKHKIVLANYKIECKDSKIRMNNVVALDFLKNISLTEPRNLRSYPDEKTIFIKIHKKNTEYEIASIQITGHFKFMIKIFIDEPYMLNNCVTLINMIVSNRNLLYYPIV